MLCHTYLHMVLMEACVFLFFFFLNNFFVHVCVCVLYSSIIKLLPCAINWHTLDKESLILIVLSVVL